MKKSNLSQNQNSKPRRKKNDPRYKRVVVGYRLVPMTAEQVDEVARMEGRGDQRTIVDGRLRCPWCFLKGGVEGNHFCRWRTENGVRPVGGKIRRVPIYQYVLKDGS